MHFVQVRNCFAHWGIASLWLCGIALFTALTVHDVIPLIQEYQYDNTATQMRIIPRNQSIRGPSLTFCIPYFSTITHLAMVLEANSTQEDLDRQDWLLGHRLLENLKENFIDLTKETSAIPSDHDHDVRETNAGLIAAVVFQKFLQSGTLEALDFKNAAWNQPIFDSVWSFFRAVGTAYENEPKLERYHLYQIDNVLSEKRVVETLYERLIRFLCNHMWFKNDTYEFCVETLLTVSSYVFDDAFCFPLPLSNDQAEVDVRAIGRNGAHFHAFDKITRAFRVYADVAMISWPLDETTTRDALAVSGSETPVATSQETLHLNYFVVSTVTVKPGDNCFQQNSVVECARDCMVHAITHGCRCVPFPFRRTQSAIWHHEYPFCNISLCLNLTRVDAKCEAGCGTPCEHFTYHWHITRELKSSGNHRNFALDVNFFKTPYVQFNMTEKQTWQQFVSSIAAIMGLYLGVSGLTIVGLISEIIAAVKKWKRPGDIPNLAENERSDVNHRLQAIETAMATVIDVNRQMQQKLDAISTGLKRRNTVSK